MVGAGTDKTKAPVSGGPAVILVRPQLAVNIGMCARAMANFGLDDLRLVNPRAGWPRTDEYREVAYSAAAGATAILDCGAPVRQCRGGGRRLPSRLRRDRPRARAGEARPQPERGDGGDRGFGRREARHSVRPRAHRTRQRRGRDRRGDRHLSLESGLRLAQPGAGGALVRLRVVQGRARRRAAALGDPALRLAPGAARDAARLLRLPRGRSWTRAASSGPRPRSRACGATCATSFTAWS